MLLAERRNVLGGELATCSNNPKTGFFRNGCCDTNDADLGAHVVCAKVTDEFLTFSKQRGNDLSTPVPEYGFPGLKAGDHWCLCAARWKEARDAGVLIPVNMEATHERALEVIPFDELLACAEISHQEET